VDLSARNVDINFAALTTYEEMKAYSDTIRARAHDEYNREIRTMTYGLVVCRDTEKEAKAAFQHVIDEGDWGAAENVMKVVGLQSQSFNEQIRKFQERFIAGWGGFPVVGTPEQVTEQLGKLNEAGMDGMIMGMVDYNEEMKYFGAEVMPLLKQAGLRH
jgi:alkanesulfonate monooxygenase SsuD/methylene tetrahydromethanopterin reductase-like flavin-dependent oxidoreductase (luciferase family)